MKTETRRHAALLLTVLPTVVYGGVSLLSLLTGGPDYAANPLRQDLWRAGHAHAGVLLLQALISLLLVEHATLSPRWERLATTLIPLAAILLPLAFFLSMPSPADTRPNRLILLAPVGAVSLSLGLVILGVGLWRTPKEGAE